MSSQTLNWDCQVRARACILGLVHPRNGLFAETSFLCLCEITLRALSFGVVSSPALDLELERDQQAYQVFCLVRTRLGFRYSAVLLDEVASLLPRRRLGQGVTSRVFVYLLPFLTLYIATVLISQGESPSDTRYRDLFARGFVTFQYCIP